MAVAIPQSEADRAQEILQRDSQLDTQLQHWLPTWQEIAELGMPRKANVNLRRTPGSPQTERLLDSTMVHAGELLAASMHGSLTSGSITWFYYRVRGLEVGKFQNVDKYLEQVGEISYDELRQSNFGAEAHEFYNDLGMIGTAAMFMRRRESVPGKPWMGVRFETLSPGSYKIAEDSMGRVDTLHYDFKRSHRNAVAEWDPEQKGGVLPESVYKKAKDAKTADEEYTYVHAVYPRKDVWPRRNAKVIAAKKRPWASVMVCKDDPKIVHEDGYYKFPYAVARWTKASGEIYGRSPGYTALPDAKTLMKLIELKLRALANMVYPPLKVRDNGVLGTVRLSPGALTHVRDMDAVEPLRLEGRVDTAVMEIDKLQQAIRRVFFSDQLQLQEGPQMTATEVQVRYELMQRILGPTLGRLEVEFLEPVVEWVYDTLERAGLFGDEEMFPEELKEHLEKNRGRLDIEYEGPLQRAQRLANVVTIQRFMQLVLPFAEFDNEIMDNVDLDQVTLIAHKDTGAPKQIIRNKQDRDRRRNERRAQQQKQMEAQQAQESAKAIGAAAPAMKALGEAQQLGLLPQGSAAAPGGVPVGAV